MIRKLLFVLAILLLIIQLFRPEKNIATTVSTNAIEKHYTIPEDIKGLLKTSCYDCHSNNTVYPWYSKVQPFAWWLDNHVKDGKQEINFDEFNSYTAKKKKHKLDEVVEMIEQDEMPLRSYTVIHTKAVLSPQDKNSIIAWAKDLQKTIK
ncbi:MAG: heme-binding domain-containing protein [Pedobacter sp.]|nr:heme-binding domain-containing protein [Pedobacter sp.]